MGVLWVEVSDKDMNQIFSGEVLSKLTYQPGGVFMNAHALNLRMMRKCFIAAQ